MTNTKQTTTLPTAPRPVWFITGCSTGFGRELAIRILESGDRAVVTARHPEQVKEFDTGGENTLILKLDVTKQDQADAAVQAAEAHFGRIDVLVNNAGIGYFAGVEEGEEEPVRRMFDVNLFGMNRMIRTALPGMRRHGRGTIVNVSSIGGIVGMAGLGYYNATKFAVEGLSEALRHEVEPLGIHVIVVEPSGFRTDWAGRSANESKISIPAYAATAGASRHQLRKLSGNQEGDPARAASAIVAAVQSPNPPRHLLLGNAAYDLAIAKLVELQADFAAGEAVARAADFPKNRGHSA